MRVFSNICFFASTVLTGLLTAEAAFSNSQNSESYEWRDDWELAENLTMDIDTTGYQFPSHIVFVGEPGTDPKDPLYFVLELKGKIKVVTNDRSVHIFADDVLPIAQAPDPFEQAGLTGLCLEPQNGYVFVTFAYLDKTQVYRNGMARYSTTPKTFGLEGKNRLAFLDLFREERSATSHQIGPCQVAGGNVFTAVGYGDEKAQAQNLHSTLGSIIRSDLDFNPLPDNPFFDDDGVSTAIDYIWAYGIRNVFGLKMVEKRLFATENGGNIDRFNEIESGKNYLWNGTDWGIGALASQVFAPSIGLVHLDYIDADNNTLPKNLHESFVTVAAGPPGEMGRSIDGKRSLIVLKYDFDRRQMAGVPHQILNYRGEGMQIPVSTAVGPDGLYFLPLLPDPTGNSTVFKITFDTTNGYPHRIGSDETPQTLINRYNCRQCHTIGGKGGKFAPSLDDGLQDRLIAAVNDTSYEKRMAAVDAISSEPFIKYRDVRREILEASGRERALLWLIAYLQEPSFDNPKASMPRLDVTIEHATTIAQHLLQQVAKTAKQKYSTADHIRFFIAAQIPDLRYRHLLLSFLFGALLSSILLLAARTITRRKTSS